MKEIPDFSTSVMWWNVKLIHMWRNFRFLLILHVQKFEISPHDRFFLHGHRPCVRDKYEVWSLWLSLSLWLSDWLYGSLSHAFLFKVAILQLCKTTPFCRERLRYAVSRWKWHALRCDPTSDFILLWLTYWIILMGSAEGNYRWSYKHVWKAG